MFQESHGGGVLKLEDEIVLQFRALGYPFTISKTSLVAAGSPHAWPGLLAALAWLVEQLNMVESHLPPDKPTSFVETADLTVTIDSVEDLDMQSQNAFFDYLLDAYAAFLNDNMEEYGALRGLLTDRFARDDAFFENEIERIQNYNATMAARMEELREDVKE
jgi:kinetochore protein NDC80